MRTKVYFENPKVRHHLGGQSVGRNIILNWILKKEVVVVWTGFSVLMIESSCDGVDWIQCAYDRIQL